MIYFDGCTINAALKNKVILCILIGAKLQDITNSVWFGTICVKRIFIRCDGLKLYVLVFTQLV